MLELITIDGRRRKICLECRAVHSKRNCPVAKRQRAHIKRVHAWLLKSVIPKRRVFKTETVLQENAF